MSHARCYGVRLIDLGTIERETPARGRGSIDSFLQRGSSDYLSAASICASSITGADFISIRSFQ